MLSLIYRFFEVPRWLKRTITVFVDALFIAAALIGALFIRVGENWTAWYKPELSYVIVGLVIGSILIWVNLGLYRAIIRYLDVKVLSNIFWGTVGSVFLLLALLFTFKVDLPRSTPFIYATLIMIFVAGSRLVIRGLINTQNGSNQIPVAIYGAGSSGWQLCLSLQNGAEYEPVLFVDDDEQRQGTSLAGVPVYSPAKIASLIEKQKIQKVLFAIPSASTQQRQGIFNRINALGVEILTIPGSADLVSGKVNISQLRNIDIQDLLGREAVAPEPALMDKCISAKTVLVTGAGGSIGSELCRQIVKRKPEQLIIFELSEFNLYSIDAELRAMAPELTILPVMGSVQDKELVEQIVGHYQVQTIYHAAAYKHVPLVEYNIAAGLKNNVWGTKTVADAALKFNVEHFVLVSTDKAVRPTNVMGTSKRLAELVVQDLASRSQRTVFSMVRFGNVLGSSGSVIPLFRKQIEAGGPVTVTHAEITRYFMTIPEAASLVIQAGAMAEGGEVFVLDMGRPVKIADMAEQMINLMGLSVRNADNPDGDIEIVFSGLRPGEKLYEELLIGGEVHGTSHPRIMRAMELVMSNEALTDFMDTMIKAMNKHDGEMVRSLLENAPTGYTPVSPLVDLIWQRDTDESLSSEAESDAAPSDEAHSNSNDDNIHKLRKS